MLRTGLVFTALLAVPALMLSACSDDGASASPSDVTFDVELIEVKGATDGIDEPSTDPATLSDGYRFTPAGEFDPENPDKWQVSTYMFSPGAMSVVEGDTVNLRMFGVNGDTHDVWVAAPDGSMAAETVVVERGREVTLEFTANEPGHYKLFCGIHGPTMQADILSV